MSTGDVLVVLARCGESSTIPQELRKRSLPYLIYQKSGKCNSSASTARLQRDHGQHEPPVRWMSHNRGDECSAYLQYIVDHYRALPKAVAFLQYSCRVQMLNFGNTRAGRGHGSPAEALAAVQAGSLNASRGYVALGRHSFEGEWPGPCEPPARAERFVQCAAPLVRRVMGRNASGFFRFYANGLFVVSRARIRARPLGWYKRLLGELSGTGRAACDDADTRGVQNWRRRLMSVGDCHVLEKLWHVVFGEPFVLPPPHIYNEWRAPGAPLPPSSRIGALPELTPAAPDARYKPARCGAVAAPHACGVWSPSWCGAASGPGGGGSRTPLPPVEK